MLRLVMRGSTVYFSLFPREQCVCTFLNCYLSSVYSVSLCSPHSTLKSLLTASMISTAQRSTGWTSTAPSPFSDLVCCYLLILWQQLSCHVTFFQVILILCNLQHRMQHCTFCSILYKDCNYLSPPPPHNLTVERVVKCVYAHIVRVN